MKSTGTKEKAPTQLTLKKVILKVDYPPITICTGLLIDTAWSQRSSKLPEL